MTITLVLLRHAKSSWEDQTLDDRDRPLAPRGKRDARRVGDYLAQSGLHVDEVLCSPSLRTRETWARVRSRFRAAPPARFEPALYLPTLTGFVSALAAAQRSTRTLLVVGHSPVLDAFVLTHATRLTPALRARLVDGLPTGSVTVLAFSIGHFGLLSGKRRHQGTVSAFTSPRDLAPVSRRPAEQPVKGERVEITKQSSMRTLASDAFASAVHQLRANAHGAHAAERLEFGHHQRVAARRLRLYVKLFGSMLGKQRANRLGRELRWLFRTSGSLREHDVFAASPLGTSLLHTRKPALKPLAQRLRRSRAEHHRALQEALDGPRYLHLVRDLVALETELSQPGRGSKRRARRFLSDELARRWKRVRKFADAVADDDVAAHHELRKDLKKLRYTAELGRGAFGRRKFAGFLDGLAALQDELGARNDAAAERVLLERALTALAQRPRAAAEKLLPEPAPPPTKVRTVPAQALRKLTPFW